MSVIITERLGLHPLSPAMVAALVEGDLDAARGLTPHYDIHSDTFAEDEYVLRLRRDQLSADPSSEPWLLRAAVLKGARTCIGRIGFHAPPDDDAVVEIGYRTARDQRRRGFALEMARGLMTWGAAHGARRCIASVVPANTASLATLKRLGFQRVGERLDAVDGLEWLYTLEL